MNKIKLMYDVAKAMKEKEVFIGSLEATAKKDQGEFFTFKNEFDKNLTTGQVKVKVNAAFDMDGKQMKHESSSEFTITNCCGARHPHLRRPLHHHHCNNMNTDSGCCHTDLKEKLSLLAYAFNLLENVKIEELENKALYVTLKVDEIPENLINHIHGRFQHGMTNEEMQGQEQHLCMKEFMVMENPLINLNMHLTPDKTVESIVVTAEGKQTDSVGEIHDMNFKAELNMKW